MTLGEEAARAEQKRIITLLRRAAKGRRIYAEMNISGTREAQERLLLVADALDQAIALIQNPDLILDLVPSWTWTEEEFDRIRKGLA